MSEILWQFVLSSGRVRICRIVSAVLILKFAVWINDALMQRFCKLKLWLNSFQFLNKFMLIQFV
ncbi:hypothetical protein M6B38_119675 [Iris pallida]|uniref:Uncharacterized protein n=1 Tax=Iris pallida TaxID=29817 RepID=A0AAX6HA35_IRIPA|nr:hypothetical protein M6B38_119675 [Iris pallida]